MAGYLLVSNMSTPQTKVTSPDSPFLDKASCDGDSCAADRIIEAAKKLFYKLGIRGVSVDAIAAEADTTKVTFYRVFDSKEALVVKVLAEKSRSFWSWWDSVISPHEGNPRAQIEALLADIQRRIADESAARGCLMCNTAVEVVEDDHPARELISAYRTELVERLRSLCRAMGARQPDVLGDSLSLLLTGLFSARIGSEVRQQAASVVDAAKALIDSPALGVGPRAKR
jgi:AcrR family transcriptional regulator